MPPGAGLIAHSKNNRPVPRPTMDRGQSGPPDKRIRAAPIRNSLEPLANNHQISLQIVWCVYHRVAMAALTKDCVAICLSFSDLFFRECREHALGLFDVACHIADVPIRD
jgi:hypothetical protein